MSKEKGRWEPTTTRGSPTTNESDPALAMPLLVASVLVLIVFSFGFASICYQCLKLRKALHRRQIKPELTPGELKSLQEQHKSSHEELAAEIQSLTQLQTQVTSQLVQLRQLVQMAKERHQGVGDHDKTH